MPDVEPLRFPSREGRRSQQGEQLLTEVQVGIPQCENTALTLPVKVGVQHLTKVKSYRQQLL